MERHKQFSILVFFMALLFGILHSCKSQELFVEETGETDFIPIETEEEIHKILSPKIQRPKRQASSDYDAYNYDYTNDEDSEDSEDYESSGEMYTDLDQAAYDTEDDNEDIYTSSNTEVTPVIPVSRVVPTLVSPSFDDPGSFGNVVVTDSMPVPRNSAFDVIKTALYDDEFEGKTIKFGTSL